jgi:hypothetical protein
MDQQSLSEASLRLQLCLEHFHQRRAAAVRLRRQDLRSAKVLGGRDPFARGGGNQG